jgi:hypothetical protein
MNSVSSILPASRLPPTMTTTIPAPAKDKETGQPEEMVYISAAAQKLEAWRSWAAEQGLGKTEDDTLFAKYKDRLSEHVVAHFTDKDKALLGQAYQVAEASGESSDRNMEKIDKLANKLGAYRIQQELDGELVKRLKKAQLGGTTATETNTDKLPIQTNPTAAQEEEEEDWNPIHLEILGEMKKWWATPGKAEPARTTGSGASAISVSASACPLAHTFAPTSHLA